VNLWFISDTHFSHENILRFSKPDGTPLRWFHSAEEMDETMIERWNAVVRPQDHIYHLGDVALNKPSMERIMPRLNGHKRLVRGNHDVFPTKFYLKWFKEIHGCRVLDNIVFSHIPIHSGSLGRFKGNAHGHLHANLVLHQGFPVVGLPDTRYLNICVEQTHYHPVSLDFIKSRLEAQ